MRKAYLIAPLIATLALPVTALSQTTFTDTFDGTLTTLSSTSFAWYSRDGTWSYTAGNLASSTNERAAVGYFVNPGEYLTLSNIGDSISLTVNFVLADANQTGADRFRIGLLGSGPTPISANWSANHAADDAAGSVGIIGTIGHLRGTSGGGSVNVDSLRLYDRDTASLLVMGDNNPLGNYYTALGVGGAAYTYPGQTANSTIHTASLAITMTGTNTVSINYTFSQGATELASMSLDDVITESLYFDHVGLFARTPAVQITDITVSYSAIPEPSTYAAIFGALALGLVAFRRRQLAKRAA